MSMTHAAWLGLVCWLTGLLLVLGLTPLVRRWAIRHNLLDRAGQFHTTHTIAVPRLGGIALAATFTLLWLLVWAVAADRQIHIPHEAWTILGSCLAMFGLGLWDDLRPLGARFKLTIQIVIATVACFAGLNIECWTNPFTQQSVPLGLLDAPLTVLWMVGVTNLINLVDGLDGLAVGVSLILMILLSIVSAFSGNFFLMGISLGMTGALLAFLMFNFPPARIFLGDGGAYFLGLLIAQISVVNSNKGTVVAALIVPFFALGLPVIDTLFSIFRRALVGLPIFRADRRHIHHRLAAMGFSKRRVVWLLYAACALFAVLALGILISRGRWLPLLFGVFLALAILSARLFGYVQNWYKLGRVVAASVLRRRHTHYALLLGRVLAMDAERCGSLDALWEEFTVMLRKLGFHEAVLTEEDAERRWSDPKLSAAPSSAAFRTSYETRGPPSGQLSLTAREDRWDHETAWLLSELCAEAWSNAHKKFLHIRNLVP